MIPTPDWAPFEVVARGEHSPGPRSIQSAEGIGDRLRAAAFAEIQAREAFNWASEHFGDASPALRTEWKGLALAEDRHYGWLLKRMQELGVAVTERRVSDQLWVSLRSCKDAREFALYMANAEDRGRQAGERFCREMESRDPMTARIFGEIAKEEVAHIALAARYFPSSDAAIALAP